ncbi:MAG: hypothetical protein WCD76_14195 [Pyrinomonadaceae bacterium]
MMNPVRKIYVALAAACLLLTLAATTEAQRRPRAYMKAEVNDIIRRVENRSDEFVRLFDSSLDRSRLDGTKREDRLNEHARNLERALDDLRREFDRRENYNQTKPEVSRALNVAEDINKVMRRRRMGGETERQWLLLRSELNALALVYNLRPLR